MANKRASGIYFYLDVCFTVAYQNENDFLILSKSYQNDSFYHFENNPGVVFLS